MMQLMVYQRLPDLFCARRVYHLDLGNANVSVGSTINNIKRVISQRLHPCGEDNHALLARVAFDWALFPRLRGREERSVRPCHDLGGVILVENGPPDGTPPQWVASVGKAGVNVVCVVVRGWLMRHGDGGRVSE